MSVFSLVQPITFIGYAHNLLLTHIPCGLVKHLLNHGICNFLPVYVLCHKIHDIFSFLMKLCIKPKAFNINDSQGFRFYSSLFEFCVPVDTFRFFNSLYVF